MTTKALNKQQIPTRTLHDFHGGIHPEQFKEQSNQTPIVTAPVPPVLYIPLQQHIGKAAEVCVEVGQTVLKGQVLATPQGPFSAAVHASTSGLVKSICQHPIAHPSGMQDWCVELIPDGRDSWCQLDACPDYDALSADQIRSKVRHAGIAGMGGAGFPTEVKLHPPRYDKVATLILNAAECEPYITSDDRLLRERASEVIKGMEIIAYVLQPGECVIGIEDNKPEAIAALREAACDTRIDIAVIPTKYPSGGEKQLIKILTGKEVPSGKIPADIGVVCQNVGTTAAIYRAVRFGEPLISRVTTLTGQQIKTNGNVETLIGTPISWLIEHYGYTPAKQPRVIMGGPMMGFSLTDLDTPIVKTSNCILAPSLTELPLDHQAQACIRCGLCAEACPAELLPQQLYWFARAQEYEKAEHHNLFDCIECGACSYVCPSAIPLVHYYRHSKGEIRKQRQEQLKSDQARLRFEARQARLEREQAEKEAKRKARAEAAAKAQAAKKAAQEQHQAGPDPTPAPVDASKAAVAAALARSQAKHDEAAIPPDIDALKTAWDKAQIKLEKMLDAMEQAKQDNPDQVEKLTRAVEKNQLRVNQAKQQWQLANKQAPSPETMSNAAPITIDQLVQNLEKAKQKLAKTQDSLASAQQGSDESSIEKLSRAVSKNQLRLEAAEHALAAARSQLASQEQL